MQRKRTPDLQAGIQKSTGSPNQSAAVILIIEDVKRTAREHSQAEHKTDEQTGKAQYPLEYCSHCDAID